MKILHWAIIFVVIILPISMICSINVNAKFTSLKDEVRINNAIDTATQDAINQLISMNSVVNFNGKFGDIIDVTPGLAQEMIDTFFHTLATNYNIPYQAADYSDTQSDSYIKNYFSSYVPAIVILAYDGFYVYSLENNGSGYEYQLSTKIPYVPVDELKDDHERPYYIGYTLGNDIYLHYNGISYSGKLSYNSLEDIKNKYEEYKNNYEDSGLNGSEITLAEYIYMLSDDMSCILYAISRAENIRFDESIMPAAGVTNFLADYTYNLDGTVQSEAGPFHQKRQETIIEILTSTLNEEINVEQNEYANIMGITYDFSFPALSRQDWMNTIEDISFFAFVQGIPIGNAEGTFYNNFALGGSKIVRSEGYTLTTTNSDGTGTVYYHESTCPLLKEIEESYVMYRGIKSKQEAVKNHKAYPCLICN